jgi:hypothetical protein
LKTAGLQDSGEYSAQAAPNALPPVNMLCPDIARDLCSAHYGTEMTGAGNSVQLTVGQLEKPLRLPVSVVLQPSCPKERVTEGNGDRRIVATDSRSHRRWLIFGLLQCREDPVGIPFEKLDPTLETFVARHELRVILAYPGKGLQLIEFMVLHIVLPTSDADDRSDQKQVAY